METELVRVRVTVHGRVQMVGFRDFVVRHAVRLDLRGTVANRPDRTVECVLEGRPRDVEAMVALLRHGPPAARVDGLDLEWEQPTGAPGPLRVTA